MKCWSSAKSNPKTLFNMGVAYESGRYSTKGTVDLERAHQHYMLAASLGHKQAIYNLSLFYLYGKGGIAVDLNRAETLLRRAATLGVKKAEQYIQELEVRRRAQTKQTNLMRSSASAPNLTQYDTYFEAFNNYDSNNRSNTRYLQTFAIVNRDCCSPLGLMDGRIHDWQLSASSNYDRDPNCNVKYARIHVWPGRGWCADTNRTNDYLQIDLGFETAINGIITQGRADGKSWIKHYHLLFSGDANVWTYYNDKQKLLGNKDSHSLQYHLLTNLVITRFVRIEVIAWHNNPGLRVELLGCRKCDSIINYPPRSLYKASSARNWPQDAYCSPEDAYID
ncbi:unnamed protein product, partial [Oppiella nova]